MVSIGHPAEGYNSPHNLTRPIVPEHLQHIHLPEHLPQLLPREDLVQRILPSTKQDKYITSSPPPAPCPLTSALTCTSAGNDPSPSQDND